ncbi:hypothetical protein EGH24_10495 [Halonotius terrestris]|uniref:Uncharacterized protein n=1 Tax=Halonotius terrestris TaxID=2487750 RepID=A0A8J8PBT5_9EURY|nr:hypothetical protein [Halonotius terrestris]TQQ79902.1 hypothetical protein EGH24_10495 [Halonotius terrestris]
MADEATLGKPTDDQQTDQTEIVLLDDDTEQEIGAVSAESPPIPGVGDLVSLQNFQFGDSAGDETEHPRGEEDGSFRVVDRAIHYSIADQEDVETELTTEVLLYVVSKEEWAVRRQRGT